MTIPVKICGIKDKDSLNAAVKYGARFVGFVFCPSPRHIIDVPTAAMLIRALPTGVEAVGLFVNPTDGELETACTSGIGMIQLHGNETPQRVKEIQQRFNLPVMKAIRIAHADDLAHVVRYEEIADWLLFDAKVKGQTGGTGQVFDWTILKNFKSQTPWMLAGGLNATNIKAALEALSPHAIDISSGVESAPGIKDPVKIKEFMDAVALTL